MSIYRPPDARNTIASQLERRRSLKLASSSTQQRRLEPEHLGGRATSVKDQLWANVLARAIIRTGGASGSLIQL